MKLSFKKKLNADCEKLFEIATDFENMTKLFPLNLKSRVIKKTKDETVLEEIAKLSFLNYKIKQITSYKKIDTNTSFAKVIQGPFKGTEIKIHYQDINSGTEVSVDANVKYSKKFFWLAKVIKKRYENALLGILKQVEYLALLTQGKNWKDSISNDGNCLTISGKDFGSFTVFGWPHTSLISLFCDDVYKFLPAKNKVIIDVGANIGDSALYFISKGAKNVIALEPFPKNFELAKKNIESNNLSDKVTVLLAGCSGQSGMFKINPEISGTCYSTNSENGMFEIKKFSLKDLVNQFHLNDALIKIDCEGCEYDTIIQSTPETLQKFSHMIIEFHEGFEKLKKKLEDSNFLVVVNTFNGSKSAGHLHCTRQGLIEAGKIKN